MASINAIHRRHFKSGSCLERRPLGGALFIGKRFRRLLDQAAAEYERSRKAGEAKAVLTRPQYFERMANPRSTQSLFGKVASKVAGLFGRKEA